MEKEEINDKLENMSTPQIPPLYKSDLKLTILSTKKSSRLSFLLLLLPAIILFEALCETVIHVLLPPWQWLVKYGHLMPLWLRLSIYVFMLIVLPLTVAFLNILAITWIKYDKERKLLNISIRIEPVNIIITSITAAIGLLFIGHTVAQWINDAG